MMHTPADLHALAANGINPDSVQPRERSVPCRCMERTFNLSGRCDRHYRPPFMRTVR